VLAIKASGMCGSDLNHYRGKGNPAVIAGHEPCGVVAAVGDGVSADFAPIGARVMNHHYKVCGHCKHCRAGWSQLCHEWALLGVSKMMSPKTAGDWRGRPSTREHREEECKSREIKPLDQKSRATTKLQVHVTWVQIPPSI